jgi:hypothetical protein
MRPAALLVALALASPAAAQIFLPAPGSGEPGEGAEPIPPGRVDLLEDPDGPGTLAAPDREAGAPDPGAGHDEGREGFLRAPETAALPEPELILGPETAPRPGARLRKLDKMTGASKAVEVAAGARAELGRLVVELAACEAPPDGRLEGTRAFLRVWDTKRDAEEPAFAGWMFAESPALSALDHPRFDVWVISCTTS